MEIKIDTKALDRHKISLAQYLFMFGVFYDCDILHVENLTPMAILDLIDRDYIAKYDNSFHMQRRGVEIFESDNELFDKFIELFPTRVSNEKGETRVLSPSSSDTIIGKRLKKKWNSITKNDRALKEKIITCLNAEMSFRKSTGNLYWMRSIEAWLNAGTWEDYEYLLTVPLDEKQSTFGRVGEIEI